MDPSRPGLEGYGEQQDNDKGLREYHYDAATGEFIWDHAAEPEDVGRGMVGDIDPRHAGMEAWVFDGLYNAPANELTTDTEDYPYPQIGIFWWDDVLLERMTMMAMLLRGAPERARACTPAT